MASTITGYTTFVFDTLIDETEVNENFSNHRGTLVPIEEATATASDNTHDLGSTSHRWKDLHLAGNANIQGDIFLTSTGAVYWGDSAVDGNWRVIKSGANLSVEVRVASAWVVSHEFTVPS